MQIDRAVVLRKGGPVQALFYKFIRLSRSPFEDARAKGQFFDGCHRQSLQRCVLKNIANTALYHNLPLGGLNGAGKCQHGGGFAGTVGAHDCHKFTFAHGKIHTPQYNGILKRHMHAFETGNHVAGRNRRVCQLLLQKITALQPLAARIEEITRRHFRCKLLVFQHQYPPNVRF